MLADDQIAGVAQGAGRNHHRGKGADGAQAWPGRSSAAAGGRGRGSAPGRRGAAPRSARWAPMARRDQGAARKGNAQQVGQAGVCRARSRPSTSVYSVCAAIGDSGRAKRLPPGRRQQQQLDPVAIRRPSGYSAPRCRSASPALPDRAAGGRHAGPRLAARSTTSRRAAALGSSS